MVAIWDFTHNAMAKIIPGHTIMSGIPENNVVAYILAKMILLFDLGQNGDHFRFLCFTSTLLNIQ